MHLDAGKACFQARRASSKPRRAAAYALTGPRCDLRHWPAGPGACYKDAPRAACGVKSRARMAFPVRTCALVGRFSDPRIAESVGTLLPHLASRGVQVLVAADAQLAPELSRGVTRVPEEQIGGRADLVIAVGGDGTLLYGARLV